MYPHTSPLNFPVEERELEVGTGALSTIRFAKFPVSLGKLSMAHPVVDRVMRIALSKKLK